MTNAGNDGRLGSPLTKTDVLAVYFPHITRNINTAIRWGFPSWAAVRISEHLAGKVTFVELIGLVKEDLCDQVGWLSIITWVILSALATGATMYARQKTRYLSNRIAQLESSIDPNRTSSGLMSDGTTHPRDKTE
jgi:hypothetical protein